MQIFKHFLTTDLKDESFPDELRERDFLYWKGFNNKSQKICK